MTISATNNRDDYTGTGSVSAYDFTFKVFSSSQLLVTQRDTSNVETTLVLNTNYTVSLNTDGTGTITLTAGNLTSGYTLTIQRSVSLTQTTADIRNQGAYYPETIEDRFDYQTMIDQQQQDQVDRSIKLPETVDPSSFSTLLPATIAASGSDKFVAVNSTGDGFQLVDSISDGEISFPAGTGILAKVSSSSSQARTITGTSDEITISDGDGVSGNPTLGIADNPVLPGTEGVQIPSGTTAQRPGTPVNGDLRYNSSTGKYEAYEAGAWYNLLGQNFDLGLAAAQTSVAADSIKITHSNGSALASTNPAISYVNSTSSPGQITKFTKTSDTTIDLTGAHWGYGTTGDITDMRLFVYEINDAGTQKFGVAISPYLTSVSSSDDETTATSVTSSEKVLVNSALSASSSCRLIGWVKANFDDTGGSSEDLWAVQTSLDDIHINREIIPDTRIIYSNTTVFALAAAPSSWTDLDLSGTTGKGRFLVTLKVISDGANLDIKFRTNGESYDLGYDTANSYGGGMSAATTADGRACYVSVITDTRSVIEWKKGSGGSNAAVSLLTYQRIF